VWNCLYLIIRLYVKGFLAQTIHLKLPESLANSGYEKAD